MAVAKVSFVKPQSVFERCRSCAKGYSDECNRFPKRLAFARPDRPRHCERFTTMHISGEYAAKQDYFQASTLVYRLLLLPVFATLALIHVFKVILFGDDYS